MFGDGDVVAEGSGQNLFLIKNSKISTPPIETGALGGITRRTAIEIASNLGYETVEQNITKEDFDWADRLDKTIKLVAQIDSNENGFNARVHPVLIDKKHPLAAIRGALNAVVAEGENIDQLVFSGPGAGANPTASAVMGDVLSACHQLNSDQSNWYPLREYKGENKNFEDVESSMFIRLSVKDEPGVLAKIAGTFGENNVSIESVIQEGRGDKAELVLVTHEAPEKDLNNSINQISSLDAVTTVTSLLRVYV